MSELHLTVDDEPSIMIQTPTGFVIKTLNIISAKNYRIVREFNNSITYFNFSVSITGTPPLKIAIFDVPYIPVNFLTSISPSYSSIPSVSGQALDPGIYKLHAVILDNNGNVVSVRESPAEISVGEKYSYGNHPTDPTVFVEIIYFRKVNGEVLWVDHLGNEIQGGSITGDPIDGIDSSNNKGPYNNPILIFFEVTATPNIIFVPDSSSSSSSANEMQTESYLVSGPNGNYDYEIFISSTAVRYIGFIAYLRIKDPAGNYVTGVTSFTVPDDFSILSRTIIGNYYKFEVKYTGLLKNIDFKIT